MSKRNAIEPKVGDILVVPGSGRRPRRVKRVIKVARVKFYVIDNDLYERFSRGDRVHIEAWRKDTAQEDGVSHGYSTPKIMTPEQESRHVRFGAAEAWLRSEVGLETYRLKEDVIDVLDLANLIRTEIGLEEL